MKLTNYNKIISANWKMNGSLSLIDEFKRFFTKNYENLNNDIAVIICPPSNIQSWWLALTSFLMINHNKLLI